VSSATPARRAAYEVLRRVFEEGAWADRALRSAVGRAGLAGRDRGHAQRLAYGAVQRRGSSDHFAARLSGRPVARIDPPLLAALRLGLYEVLHEPPGDEHAAVDGAVELAKGRGRARRGAGLVNAVLRRAVREREGLLGSLDDSTATGAALAHSVPAWIAELWWRELGEEVARELLRRVNDPPRRTFRVNPIRPAVGSFAGRAIDPMLGARAGGVLIEPEPGKARETSAAVERGELVP
jgi:16S rRNA (cytosine967-C5)-methyltransferase